VSDWQHIETAPKNGTRIIVLEAGRYPYMAAWASFYSPFYRAEVDGWWTSSDPSQAHVTLPEDATAWMPLPEPPAPPTTEGTK
jgi:hypothetical protein